MPEEKTVKTENNRKKIRRRVKRPAVITDVYRKKGGVDRILLFTVIILVCFGSVMVFSASYATAYNSRSINDSFYYIKRQTFFAIIGIIAMLVLSKLDYVVIRRFERPIFIVSIILLVLVLVLGRTRNEDGEGEAIKRWLSLGPLTFQPSEVAKFSLIVTLAAYFERYRKVMNNPLDKKTAEIYGSFIPFGITIFVAGLVVLEKHLSGFGIIFMIGISLIFLSGAIMKKLAYLIGGTVIIGGAGAMMVGYTRERIDLWLHPENYEETGKIWQTLQGLRAVGSGGVLGVGLGSSQQKYMYVSAPHNDFIFSIICEELGLVGALAVIALFCVLAWRGIVISLKAPDKFSSLLAAGITIQVTLQAILNIAVVTNLFPNTGISLPFFSYGGTSLIMLLAEMGILLGISRYTKDTEKMKKAAEESK